MEPGIVFTLEPGLYRPGDIGVRIEDDMLVTQDGARSLTGFERSLTVIG
jgi:Xaa-Pro aminopeptidase